MKQFDRDDFVRILRVWDAKHHLLGRSDPFKLYKESTDALKTAEKGLLQQGCIDLGAGNGIFGIPALLEGFAERVVLIEPLVKRVAFLEAIRGEMRRVGDERHANLSVIPLPIQNVSRETLLKLLGPDWQQRPVITRAFSGGLTLKQAVASSVLCDNPLRKFSVQETTNSKKYVLVPE
ncbi:MAG: RsmG family class I SAM-dependent methyltransferase [Bdellovibrionota bacterium]